MVKSKLKDLELLWDPDYKEYFLRAVYEVEDERSVRELIIPHIVLPIAIKPNIINKSESESGRHYEKMSINVGFGSTLARTCGVYIPEHGSIENVCYVERVVKEKTQEMTIEEIEEKLGYKIKIVGSDTK